VPQHEIFALHKPGFAATASKEYTQERCSWKSYAKNGEFDLAIEALPKILRGLLPDIWFEVAGQYAIGNEDGGACYAQRQSRAGEPNFLPA
jgi:hypothetical protein